MRPRFCLIGPTYPYRGGIAHYTTLLAKELLRQEYETLLISFSRQYPSWLFPGKSDRDPSQRPLQTPAEYLLDPLKLWSWRQTLRRLRQWQPDVVVIPWWVPFWAPAWSYLGWGIKRLPHQPKLLFICHNVLPHEKGGFDKLALHIALRAGDGFITHGQPDATRLRQQMPQASVQVSPLPTYNIVGETDSPLALDIHLPTDRPLLLFFGLIRPYKGLDILLEALPDVLAQQPIHLLIAGEFWQEETLYRQMIERLRVTTAVTLINEYVPDERLSAYVHAAEVVVLPYRSATQSAIIQVAFGHHCPVIVTDVGGLAEAVADGVTGFVVAPEDPSALAKAINRFLAEGLRPQFVANIAQTTDHFSWARLVETLLTLVNTV